jgi:uncharacterized protein YbcI
MRQTKGQIEAKITEVIVKFEKESMERGPTECKTYLIDNLVVVNQTAVLTKPECLLIQSSADMTVGGTGKHNTREIIKTIRRELLEKGRADGLDKTIESLTNCKVIGFHTDISTRSGNRIIVFVLDGVPDVVVNNSNFRN